MHRLVALLAQHSQGFDRHAKEAADPLSVKVLFRALAGGERNARQLAPGAFKIERNKVCLTAAFDSASRFALVGNKAVETSAQKRSETGFRRIISLKEIFLNGAGEESLRQILRLFVRFVPFESDVLVNRLPVSSHDGFESLKPFAALVAAESGDRRQARNRERLGFHRVQVSSVKCHVSSVQVSSARSYVSSVQVSGVTLVLRNLTLEHLTLDSGKIGLELVVALVLSPQIEGKSGQFVHLGDCLWIAREIHKRKIGLARFAHFQSQVNEVWSGKTEEAVFCHFVAAGTSSARKGAAAQAQGADKIERESFSLRPQTPDLRG